MRRTRAFRHDRRGAALMEFALVFPFLFVLLFGAIELGRNVLIAERVEKAGYVLSDISSQYQPATASHAHGEISESELTTTVFPQMKTIMGIYYGEDKQRVILTAVRREAGSNIVKWQVAGGGSLSTDVFSVVNGRTPDGIDSSVAGTPADFATDPTAQTLLAQMAPGEMLLVGEMFYRYEPILTYILQGATQPFGDQGMFFLHPRTLAKRMYFLPRNGDLICLPDRFNYDECYVAASQRTGICSCPYSSSQKRSDCATGSGSQTDYYRCADGTVRANTVALPPTPGSCGGSTYGTAIENVLALAGAVPCLER